MELSDLNILLEQFAHRFFPEEPGILKKFKLYAEKSPDLSGIEKICVYTIETFDPEKLNPRKISETEITEWANRVLAIADLDMAKISNQDRYVQISAAGLVVRSIAWKLAEVMKEVDPISAHRVVLKFNEVLEYEKVRHNKWAKRFIEEIGITRLIYGLFENQAKELVLDLEKRYLIWIGTEKSRDRLAYLLKVDNGRNWIQRQNTFVKALPFIQEPPPDTPIQWRKSVHHLVWFIDQLYQPTSGEKLIKPSYRKAFWQGAKVSFVDNKGEPFGENFAEVLSDMKQNKEAYRLIIREIEDMMNSL